MQTTPAARPDGQPRSWRPVMLRLGTALRRAHAAQRRRDHGRRPRGRLLTGLVCALAGMLMIVSAINARGIDLRPARNTDLVDLLQSQARRNADLTRQVTALQTEVDRLAAVSGGENAQRQLDRQSAVAGLTPVVGPAVTVTLDDAPLSVAADGIDPDLLVVHQQDIQSVVNALWAGGAEAMTIQGQRVVATTGVKCVGNTVVLHGVPYAPPYVISAIGDQRRLHSALDASRAVQIYLQYVEVYRLGYRVRDGRSSFPGHQGALDLHYAVAG